MRKPLLAVILAISGILYAFPVQASNGITAVVLPNPIGIPEILFVIALCGFALWKKTWIRVILSLGVIIWGAFTMSTDVKFAGPLVAIGTVLFIMGITNIISSHRAQEA